LGKLKGVGGGDCNEYDQVAFHTCIKLSKNKLRNLFCKKLPGLVVNDYNFRRQRQEDCEFGAGLSYILRLHFYSISINTFFLKMWRKN